MTVPPRRTPSYMLKDKGRDLPETEFKRNVSIAHLSITCVLAMEVLSEVQCVPFHIVCAQVDENTSKSEPLFPREKNVIKRRLGDHGIHRDTASTKSVSAKLWYLAVDVRTNCY